MNEAVDTSCCVNDILHLPLWKSSVLIPLLISGSVTSPGKFS